MTSYDAGAAQPADVPNYTDNAEPCGRCGDTYRFMDGADSVCSTCGLTRHD